MKSGSGSKQVFKVISNLGSASESGFLFEEKFYKKGALLRSHFRFHFYPERIIYFKEKAPKKAPYSLNIEEKLVIEFINSESKAPTSQANGLRFHLEGQKSAKFYCENQDSLTRILDLYKGNVNFNGFSLVYRILSSIGFEIGGNLYPGRRLTNLMESSIKVIEKNGDRTGEERNFFKSSTQNEIKILRQINHPNILRLMEVFESSTSFQMVFEPINGKSLQSYLMSNHTCSTAFIRRIMSNVLSALDQLHRKEIIIRDIRPQNIILRRKLVPHSVEEAVLVDLSRAGQIDWKYLNSPKFKLQGTTPGYIPPEVMNKNEGQWSYAGDVYCAGLLLYQMIFGYTAFRGNSNKEILENNKKGVPHYPETSKCINQKAIVLVKKLLHINPLNRPTASEALRDEFFIQETSNFNDENLDPLDNNKQHLSSMRSNISKMKVSSINMSIINSLHLGGRNKYERNWSGSLDKKVTRLDSFPMIKVTFVE